MSGFVARTQTPGLSGSEHAYQIGARNETQPLTLALTYTGRIGLQETDLQLVTALIVIAAMAVPQIRRGVSGQRRLKLALAFERRKPKDERRA